MDPTRLTWLALIAGALAAGAAVVGILVVRRRLEVVVAIIGSVGAVSAFTASARLTAHYERPEAAVWSLVFVFAAGAGGYALASTLLYRLAREAGHPTMSREGAPARDRAAVVLTACAEPAHYDPGATAQMLQSLADEGLLEPSVGALPLLFFGQKARYRAAGDVSPAMAGLRAVAEHLEETLADTADVSTATCSGDGSLADVVALAAQAGYRRIVICVLAVGESMHMDMARGAVEQLRLGESGVTVVSTGALWSSERIISALTQRIMHGVDDPAATGVVLVGHGQPEERARRHRSFDEQEMAFLSRLRMALADRGLSEDWVRIAWDDWTEPDVTSAVRHLAALGAKRVLVVPATFPLDTLGTRLDLEIAVRQARVNEGVAVITMAAWRDSDAVIEELRSRVIAALETPAGA